MRNPGGWLLLLLALCLPAAAHAGDKRVAAAHFHKGRGLYDAARYDEALVAFKAGYEAYPLPGFLINIGTCHRKLDQLEEARAANARFLSSRGTDPALHGEVEDALAEVKGELNRRAEDDTQRRRAEEETRQSLLRSIAESQKAEQQRAAAPVRMRAASAAVVAPSTELSVTTAPAKKSRWWVWTLVGVGIAGAVVTGVTVGVLEAQAQTPRAGSLGLLDGRR
jgi:hypothetical protein